MSCGAVADHRGAQVPVNVEEEGILHVHYGRGFRVGLWALNTGSRVSVYGE